MTTDAGSGIEIEHDGTTVALAGPVVTIGRSKDATLRVIHPLVSRLHCRIEIGSDGVLISDLQSANGTHVNGAAVKTPVRLVRGDTVTLGKEGARLVVRRAEFDGRDLLDPELGDQATMISGDPRARDVAARVELGGGAAKPDNAKSPAPAPPKTAAPAPPRAAGPSHQLGPPRPPGPPPRSKDVPATPPPAAPPPRRPPGPPPRPRDVGPPAPPRAPVAPVQAPLASEDRTSPRTVSMVPLSDEDLAALSDVRVPGPPRASPPGAPPEERTVKADPPRGKDIYTVMPLASVVVDAAETSPIPAGELRKVREMAEGREAAARAESAADAPAAAPAKRTGLIPGLVAGLVTGVAMAYGISQLLARSGT